MRRLLILGLMLAVNDVHAQAPISAPSVNGIVNAAALPGSDIGAKISRYLAAQASSATVFIPPGIYSFSTTISIPVVAQQTFMVNCLPNSVILKYTGSGDAVYSVIGTSTQNVMSGVTGCTIDGSASRGYANGVHIKGFYGAHFDDVEVRNFMNGDGWLFQAGLVTCINCRSVYNKNGVHLLGASIDRLGTFSANGVHWIGGRIANNTQWGWYDDYANFTTAGPTYNNSIEDSDFAGNGNCSADSGNIYLQESRSTRISGNFFESQVGAQNIRLGVGSSYLTDSTQIDNNHFETPASVCGSTSVTASVNAAFADYTGIRDNEELGTVGTFTYVSKNSRVWLENNHIPAGTRMVEGELENASIAGPGGTFSTYALATGHLNQTATKNFAGTCSMFNGTSCRFGLDTAFATTPVCIAVPQGTTAIAGACSVSGTTVTITAAANNSLVWGAVLIGNPN
jgi:hypothetical protein